MIKQVQQTSEQNREQLAMETIKQRSRSHFSDQIEPINHQKTTLFFIKSKHAFRDYKNHVYFESQRCYETIESNARSRQFVQFPTPYGINNAYSYIRDEASKNLLRKHHPYNFKVVNNSKNRYSFEQKVKKQYMNRKSRRSINLTLPNLNELPCQSVLFQTSKVHKLKSSQQIQSKQPYQYINKTQIEKFYETLKPSTKLNSNQYKQYKITVIYVNKLQPFQKFGNIQLKVNIFDYIIKTFFKTKINYLQISIQQLNFVLKNAIKIFKTERQTVSYKDIVNCKNINEVFQVLLQYSQSSSEFREIIRYFFIANQQVYKYQMDCIKDQIRFQIDQQTNSINNNQKIFVFEIKSGKPITHLLQLIEFNQQRFVVGIAQNAYELYLNFTKEKNSKRDAAQRVRKWKSIIPTETHSQVQVHQISSQKYQTIFNSAQKKRGFLNKTKKKPEISIKSRSFIERDKLIKVDNIFQ